MYFFSILFVFIGMAHIQILMVMLIGLGCTLDGLQLKLRLYAMWPIHILRALIERVQTFNNEIVCNQPKVIENMPKTPHSEYSISKTISQRSKYAFVCECECECGYSLKPIGFHAKAAIISQ